MPMGTFGSQSESRPLLRLAVEGGNTRLLSSSFCRMSARLHRLALLRRTFSGSNVKLRPFPSEAARRRTMGQKR